MPKSPAFKLRFPLKDLRRWATSYEYPGEAALIEGPVARATTRGYLAKAELVAIAKWKSPRPAKRVATNAEAFVQDVTRIALDPTTSPRLAIEVLTLLDGVSWPTASVVLHLCHHAPYPILDFRALWSLSVDVPAQYTFPFWDAYTRHTRTLAKDSGLNMRTVDRALWQYSKEKQPPRPL